MFHEPAAERGAEGHCGDLLVLRIALVRPAGRLPRHRRKGTNLTCVI